MIKKVGIVLGVMPILTVATIWLIFIVLQGGYMFVSNFEGNKKITDKQISIFISQPGCTPTLMSDSSGTYYYKCYFKGFYAPKVKINVSKDKDVQEILNWRDEDWERLSNCYKNDLNCKELSKYVYVVHIKKRE